MKRFLWHLWRTIKILNKKPAAIRTEGIMRTALKVAARESFLVTGRLDYKDHSILMRVDSSLQLYRLNACKKEPHTVKWIEATKGDGKVFYDIGANVGAFSFAAALNGFRVYAFEPSFSTFAAFCENILLNKYESKIIPFCIALGSKTGMTEFTYRSLLPGEVCHTFEKAKNKSSQYVLGYRLDDFIENFALPRPQRIKIDVDGYEYEVLKGMEKTLKRPELESLQIEIEEPLKESVFTVLAKNGFSCVSDDSEMKKAFINYIFERKR